MEPKETRVLLIAQLATAMLMSCQLLVPEKNLGFAQETAASTYSNSAPSPPLRQTPTADLSEETAMPQAYKPSWTALPSLAPDLADKAFRNWLVGTTACRFPCWAGMTPGRTRWEDAVHLLQPVLDLGISQPQRCRYGECNALSWQYTLGDQVYEGLLYSKDSIVYSMELDGDNFSEPSLPRVLQTYGSPDQIYVYAAPYTPDNQPTLDVWLLYARKNFVVRYMWRAHIKELDIQACDQPYGFMLGIVAIDENQWTKLEIEQTGRQLSAGVSNLDYIRPLEDVTDLTIPEFNAAILRNDQGFCISTPISVWH